MAQYTRRAFSALAPAKSRPSSAAAPARRLWTSTSARLTRRRSTSSPPSRFRSSDRLFLLRLKAMKVALSRPQNGGAHARASSPRPGRSTFTTSAPMSPRTCVQNGPATFWVRSTTTRPSSGSATEASVACRRGLGEPPPRGSHEARTSLHRRPTLRAGSRPVATVVARLEEQGAVRAGVGAVLHAGRPARVHPGRERSIQPEVDDAALQDVDLLPEVVRDRLGRAHARREAQEARHIAGLRVVTEHLLLDAGAARPGHRRAGHGCPRQPADICELALGLAHAAISLRAPRAAAR